MALVSEVTSTPLSGQNHIDALLDNGPGWNWLNPARNVIYYTFSVSSGTQTGNSSISGGVTAFNASQQSACLSQLSYISGLTGITFALAATGDAADLHFAATNIVPSASTSGLCSWQNGWSYNGSNVVTSYEASAYVYLDNAEWAAQNSNPTAGSQGYETLLHELGHALGLKHPFDGSVTLPTAQDITSNSVMSYTEAGGNHATFSPYDVAALMWLYGGDGLGGSLGVSTAANYLVGTSGDNQLTGGSANDKLEGLAGNDTISGGSGNDTVVYSGARANYQITASGSGFSIASSADGTDILSNVEYAQFSDQAVSLLSIDSTAPTVSTFSPADEATSVAVSSNVVITFSEAIARGTGNIVLKKADGTVVETYDAAASSRLTLSGSTLTIDPTTSLANSTGYSVEFTAGCIKDSAGNAYAGTTAYNFTTVAATTTTTTPPTGSTTTPTIKVFLGSGNDSFTVTDSNIRLIANSGSDTLKIGSGASNIVTDANVERLELAGNLADYQFAVVPGSGVQILSTGGTLVGTIPSLNQNAMLAFADGSATLAQTGGSAFSLGGIALSSTAAGVSATLNSTDPSTVTATSGQSKAKIFLGTGDNSFTVNNSGITLIAGAGNDTVRLASGVTGVRTDANLERLELAGNLADYQFAVIAGSGTQILSANGTVIGTVPSLNQNATLAFADGSAPLVQTGGSAFSLGGLAVSTGSASALAVTLNGADRSTVSAGGSASTAAQAINGAGTSTDGGALVATTYTIAAGSYSHTIAGFGTGDVLDFFANASRSVTPDSNNTDGIQSLTAANAATGATTTITLTGLTAAQDAGLYNLDSFATVFGAGSIA